MTKKKRGSSSVYRTGTDSVKIRLIVLTVLAALLLLTALCAKYICPYDPYEQNLLLAKQPPGPEHLLGTDRYGRDMFSRILIAGTTSIFSTLILVSITTVTGTFVGIICGWRGGFVDAFLMRISDLFLAFPSLVFALAVAGVLGGGVQNAVLALAVVSWPKFARLARGLTLTQRGAVYNGGQTFRQQHTGSASAAYSA